MPSTTHDNIRHRLAHRAAGTLATAATAGLLALGLSAPSALAADNCANAAVRAQNNSTQLPDCRAYEMVSPPYKEGFPVVSPGDFTDDGMVSFLLRGSIAGDMHGSTNNLYHGVRSAAGWITAPLGPPAAIYSTDLGGQPAAPGEAESRDLRWSLWSMSRRDGSDFTTGFWLRGLDGAFTRVGDRNGLTPRGWSEDFSHIVASLNIGGNAFESALHEYVGTGNVGPPRPVSIDNAGLMTPGETCLRNVSSDGRVIVFSSGCNGGTLALWARVGGSATVAVSGSVCTRGADADGGLCNAVSAASYAGAAADGSRVFFTTKQQLVNGDVDIADDADVEAGNDLYACDIPAGAPTPVGSANGCTTLTEVSGTSSDAQVENVVAVSKDGSRVYFVAQGVLADNLGVGDVGPRAGASNLYMWERDGSQPSGQTKYVARLNSCPTAPCNDLARGQMTPDGRYLLFTTANRLVTLGAGADADDANDVYRYDAVTHTIVRVSTSVAGGGGNGPAPGFDASMPGASAMTADGSMVVFNSAEALSASDTNGVTDVYGWHDGQVSLISSGGGSAMGVTPSGRDIFFTTDAPVLAADPDLLGDIYDARVGGGFEPMRAPSRCSGDRCQGLLSAPLVLGAPGGGLGGNADEGVRPAIGGVARLSAADRAVLARGGRARLRLSVNRAGTVTVAGRARVGTRSRRVVSSSARAGKAGRVSVRFGLSRAARRELGRRGSLTVGLTVGFKDARPKTLTVTLTKPKFGRGGSR